MEKPEERKERKEPKTSFPFISILILLFLFDELSDRKASF
jgi:hypothetical protein